ncbi:uncharacterized protein LOC119114523 [Pollicipes pollicipes]|uniref:uncharacterized protein LOC119114523 n=1 Tax=Pollicipes pollicipes TaxID=41117 RepID=UPI001884C65D|nr:uncharacterized protein LOC119114523 [Pollicipes pollicipes]
MTQEGVTCLTLLLLLSVSLSFARGEINCYKCSSRNGTNPACHDPFSPAMSTYVRACKVPKQKHVGEFPANFCVKLTGTSTRTGEVLVIRNCVLKNMESQCGAFKFANETLHGCVLTCNYDGCNGATSQTVCALTLLLTLAAALWGVG